MRLNVITYNLWNIERWKTREAALRKFLELFSPDVFCVQELMPLYRACGVDAAHPRTTRCAPEVARVRRIPQ